MAKDKKKTGLGSRIAAARKKANLSQTELGKAFDLTRSSVSQWESENTEPTSANLRAIAKKCGVDYHWLATGEGNMVKPQDSLYMAEIIELLREAEGDVAFLEMFYSALKLRKAATSSKPEPELQDRQTPNRK